MLWTTTMQGAVQQVQMVVALAVNLGSRKLSGVGPLTALWVCPGEPYEQQSLFVLKNCGSGWMRLLGMVKQNDRIVTRHSNVVAVGASNAIGSHWVVRQVDFLPPR